MRKLLVDTIVSIVLLTKREEVDNYYPNWEAWVLN